MNAREVINNYFENEILNEDQEKIIKSILFGKDILGISPTGGGKSICYYVPTLMLDGITLIINPFEMYVQSQIRMLNDKGINAIYINSSLSNEQIRDLLQINGYEIFNIIFVDPKQLSNQEFINFVTNINIFMIVVDEAQCISQWGLDYIPNYFNIISLNKILSKRPIICAFTSTIKEEVILDITESLNLNNPDVNITELDRDNLFLEIRKTKRKPKFIVDYIRNRPSESGIIYCSTKSTIDNLFKVLSGNKISVTKDYDGMGINERIINRESFINNQKQVILMLSKFGSSIRKDNIRFVIHFNMPINLENYYREINQAGRDNKPAQCVLLFKSEEVTHNQKIIEKKILDNYEGLDLNLSVDLNLIKKNNEQSLQIMEEYCNTSSCLRNFILKYYDEETNFSCDKCSNCKKEVDMTEEAKLIINCVKEAKESYRFNIIIGTLLGLDTKKLKDLGMTNLKTYGSLKSYRGKNLNILINKLVEEHYLYMSNDEYKILKLGNIKPIEDEEIQVICKTNDEGEQSIEIVKNDIYRNTSNVSQDNNHLFNILKELNMAIAQKESIPQNLIFDDDTLIEMCNKLPENKNELFMVLGADMFKVEKYCQPFLEIIKQYKYHHSSISSSPIKNTHHSSVNNTPIKNTHHSSVSNTPIKNTGSNDITNIELKPLMKSLSSLSEMTCYDDIEIDNVINSNNNSNNNNINSSSTDTTYNNSYNNNYNNIYNGNNINNNNNNNSNNNNNNNYNGNNNNNNNNNNNDNNNNNNYNDNSNNNNNNNNNNYNDNINDNNNDEDDDEEDGDVIIPFEDDEISNASSQKTAILDENNGNENTNDLNSDNYNKMKYYKKDVLTPGGIDLFNRLKLQCNNIINEEEDLLSSESFYNDYLLIKMCIKRPNNMEELLSISNLNENELKYGQLFIDEINDYSTNNPNIITYRMENIEEYEIQINDNKLNSINEKGSSRKRKNKKSFSDKEELSSKRKELFERLKKLRKKLSYEQKIDPYMVFHDKSLLDMCKKLPINMIDFSSVYGIGDAKLKKYGEIFIKEINNFISDISDEEPFKKETEEEGEEQKEDQAFKKLKSDKILPTSISENIDKKKLLLFRLNEISEEITKETSKKIFSYESLVNMSLLLPINKEEFSQINGINEEEAQIYSSRFISEIIKFLTVNPELKIYKNQNDMKYNEISSNTSTPLKKDDLSNLEIKNSPNSQYIQLEESNLTKFNETKINNSNNKYYLISNIRYEINKTFKKESTDKITYSDLWNFLYNMEVVTKEIIDGKEVIYPTEKGINLGITIDNLIGKPWNPYQSLKFPSMIKELIVTYFKKV